MGADAGSTGSEADGSKEGTDAGVEATMGAAALPWRAAAAFLMDICFTRVFLHLLKQNRSVRTVSMKMVIYNTKPNADDPFTSKRWKPELSWYSLICCRTELATCALRLYCFWHISIQKFSQCTKGFVVGLVVVVVVVITLI